MESRNWKTGIGKQELENRNWENSEWKNRVKKEACHSVEIVVALIRGKIKLHETLTRVS